MSVFRIFSVLYINFASEKRTDVSFETCSRFPENERTFCIKRAHVLSGTNGRLGTDAVKVPVNDDSDRNITLKFEDL